MNAKGLDKHGKKIGLGLDGFHPGRKMTRLDFVWVKIVLKYGWSLMGGFWQVDFGLVDFGRVDFVWMTWVDFVWVDFRLVDFGWVGFGLMDVVLV